ARLKPLRPLVTSAGEAHRRDPGSMANSVQVPNTLADCSLSDSIVQKVIDRAYEKARLRDERIQKERFHAADDEGDAEQEIAEEEPKRKTIKGKKQPAPWPTGFSSIDYATTEVL